MVSSVTEAKAGVPSPVPLSRKLDSDIDTPTTDFGILAIPKRLRYNPDKPSHNFELVLNTLFGFTSTFTIANLYYCQPLLIEFSKSFDVTYDEVFVIPALIQAGYAVGLLLISPLGDLVRRRQLILLLVLMSTALTIGLAITPNLRVFEVLCFLIGVTSVTPQILVPLAADLATPDRRASAISVVLSGLMLGILVARVLAGIVGNFDTWRIVYYMAIGIQCLVLLGAYFLFPDFPAKNQDLTYFNILYTMAKYAVTEPLVVQAALINLAGSVFRQLLGHVDVLAWWFAVLLLSVGISAVALAYLTRHFRLDIGLFGLVGMLGVLVGPFTGRLVDNLVPWYATLVATFSLLVFQAVQTAAGGVNVSAVVIACLGLDIARQMQQVSLSTAVFRYDSLVMVAGVMVTISPSISSTARSRLNAILILSMFIGQVMGTSVGTKVFVQHGWRACSILILSWYGLQLALLVLRGPHCPRNHWFGWAGGFQARTSVVEARQRGDTSKVATPTAVERPPEKAGEGSV